MSNEEVFDRLIARRGRVVPRRPAHLRLDADQVAAMVEAMPAEQRERHAQYVDEARDSQTMLEWSNEYQQHQVHQARTEFENWAADVRAVRERLAEEAREKDPVRNQIRTSPGSSTTITSLSGESAPPTDTQKAIEVSTTVRVPPSGDRVSGRASARSLSMWPIVVLCAATVVAGLGLLLVSLPPTSTTAAAGYPAVVLLGVHTLWVVVRTATGLRNSQIHSQRELRNRRFKKGR